MRLIVGRRYRGVAQLQAGPINPCHNRPGNHPAQQTLMVRERWREFVICVISINVFLSIIGQALSEAKPRRARRRGSRLLQVIKLAMMVRSDEISGEATKVTR